ncbi:MAG: TM2 domain-containing protein [Anaerolineales bacterium]|nr:TM2 domain-containing protein [Anaerolineales bacterium]
MVQYNAQRKNPTTAVVLALLLGGLGVHKFYLEQTGMGILYLLFSWTGIPGIVAFIEAFTISRKAIQMNRQVARETAATLGGDTSTLVGMV